MKARMLFPMVGGGAGRRGVRGHRSAGARISIGGTASSSVQEVLGETGSGAKYALHVPEPWNGSLVLYAHGFRDAAVPVELDNNSQDDVLGLRNALLAQGFGVAYPSFSEHGWAVRDGTQRTHQLRGLFAARFGQPASCESNGDFHIVTCPRRLDQPRQDQT